MLRHIQLYFSDVGTLFLVEAILRSKDKVPCSSRGHNTLPSFRLQQGTIGGGSRISGMGVHIYKSVGFALLIYLNFLKYLMK